MFKAKCLRMLVLSVSFAAVSTLVGCGQKGPLYLHDEFAEEQQVLDQIEQTEQEQVIGPDVRGESGSMIPSP